MNKKENMKSLVKAIFGGYMIVFGVLFLILGSVGGIPSLMRRINDESTANLLGDLLYWVFLEILFCGMGILLIRIGWKQIKNRRMLMKRWREEAEQRENFKREKLAELLDEYVRELERTKVELEIELEDSQDEESDFEDEDDVESIDGMEGHEFEYFCAGLLEKNGFSEVNVTRGSGDQGVDIIAVKDDIKYAIQCKNYASKLGNTPIQEVSAGKIYYNCDVGVVLTNSTFTPGAIELAKATNIRLWDREVLQKLMTAANEKK